MKSIITIIATYNAECYIHTCLQALLSGSLVPHILVVDNASTDNTCNIIATQYEKFVHLIANDCNEGFGRANNIGIQYGLQNGYDYFFLLNQDAYVAPDALEQLYLACETAPEWALISPIHYNGTGTALDHGFAAYLSNVGFSHAQLQQHVGRYIPVPFVNAAAWMLRRSCIEKIGGFNPVFFHYGEDVNFMHRMQYHQLRAAIYSLASVWHDRVPRIAEKQDKEQKKGYTDFILIGLSNPQNSLSWSGLLNTLFRLAVKGLITTNWTVFLRNLKRIYWVLCLPNMQIYKNKKLTRQKGLHFLS